MLERLARAASVASWSLIGLVVMLVFGASLALWLRAVWSRRQRRRRARIAYTGESNAGALLTERGYEVVDRQVMRPWPVRVGEQLVEIELRVDYLVRRRGRLYVADAKTGRLAPSLRHGATRRQLLEYLIAYQADAALLVDMQSHRILEVDFPGLE